jgi:protoheme IX farnesyltransferase
MLPVVASPRRVAVECLVYSWLTVAVSLLLWPVATSPLYAVVAVVAGAALLFEAHRLYRRAVRDGPLHPMRLFHRSVVYLAVLFVGVAVDAALIG